MTYESEVDQIESALVSVIKEVADLSNRVYVGFYHLFGASDFPSVLLSLQRDETSIISLEQDEHSLYWNVEVHFRGTGTPETDWESFKALVGKIVDKLDANINLTGGAWQKPIDKNFVYRRDESLAFYICLITVKAVKHW